MKIKLLIHPIGFEVNIHYKDKEILNEIILSTSEANSHLNLSKEHEKVIVNKIKDIHKNEDKYKQKTNLMKFKKIVESN